MFEAIVPVWAGGFGILLNFFLLFLSLAALWVSSDYAVNYSVVIADRLRVNKLFVGFALMAVSTGIPELFVAIASIFNNSTAVATGTIIGSNIGDVSLVLGLPLLLFSSPAIKKRERMEMLVILLLTFTVMALIFSLGVLEKIEGFFLIVTYVLSIWWLFRRRSVSEIKGEVKEAKDPFVQKVVGLKRKQSEDNLRIIRRFRLIYYFFWKRLGIIFLKLAVAFSAVLLSSHFSVIIASQITKQTGATLELLGATIFAIGTSFPELVTSLQAIRKGELSLALGNSLGSVLEQGTLILGFLALFSKDKIDIIPFRKIAPFMLGSYFILGIAILAAKRLSRFVGALLMLIFVSFLYFYVVQ